MWLAFVPGPVPAQGTTAVSVACAGQRLDSIVVRSAQRTVNGVLRLPVVAEVAQLYHVTTRDHVIRDYLLLSPGDSCEELRRAESERILRAQPFIAEASIQTIAGAEGGVVLVVQTVDEAPLVLTGQFIARDPPFRAIKVGDSNVDGQAVYLAGSWQDGTRGYRDGFGGGSSITGAWPALHSDDRRRSSSTGRRLARRRRASLSHRPAARGLARARRVEHRLRHLPSVRRR